MVPFPDLVQGTLFWNPYFDDVDNCFSAKFGPKTKSLFWRSLGTGPCYIATGGNDGYACAGDSRLTGNK